MQIKMQHSRCFIGVWCEKGNYVVKMKKEVTHFPPLHNYFAAVKAKATVRAGSLLEGGAAVECGLGQRTPQGDAPPRSR